MGVRFCGYGAGALVIEVTVEGTERCYGLALGIFHCLAAERLVSEAMLSTSHACTRRLTTTFLASSLESNIDEEGLDLIGDGNVSKPELGRGVLAM